VAADATDVWCLAAERTALAAFGGAARGDSELCEMNEAFAPRGLPSSWNRCYKANSSSLPPQLFPR
jgi:hypothetical protein